MTFSIPFAPSNKSAWMMRPKKTEGRTAKGKMKVIRGCVRQEWILLCPESTLTLAMGCFRTGRQDLEQTGQRLHRLI